MDASWRRLSNKLYGYQRLQVAASTILTPAVGFLLRSRSLNLGGGWKDVSVTDSEGIIVLGANRRKLEEDSVDQLLTAGKHSLKRLAAEFEAQARGKRVKKGRNTHYVLR